MGGQEFRSTATLAHLDRSEPALSPAERLRREYFGETQPPC
jgi:hypothetical protein